MVAAEVPHLTLRDKTITVAYIISFVLEFGVSYSLPYLLYAPAYLGPKVGFIYGSVSVLCIAWAAFCLPETRRRSLEELEELWQQRVPAWRFASYVARSGLGLRVSQLERHAGAGEVSQSSEEDLKEKDVEVVHEEVVILGKEKQ
jgi:MFS transporter, SP family, sugar:H+ symporter